MATITDVAKKAGVSIATVSYVLNGRTDLVRQETAERIRRAAEELNYSANPVARGLATGSSFTVAVVLPDHSVFSHPIGSQEFLGVAEEFYMSNYSMLIKPSYADARRMKHPHTSIPKHVAGVLVLGPMAEDNPDLQEARALNKPIVVAEDVPDEWGVAQVNADNFRAAKLVTESLIDQGHANIALISQINVSACMTRRIKGYRTALEEKGLEVHEALMFDAQTQDPEEIERHMEEIMSSPLKPTALVVLNSAMLPPISEFIAQRGIKVPQEFAVGCVDYGMPPNFRLEWPLVTLSLDLRQQGELAARTLVEMLKNKESHPENRYILPELVVLHPD